MSEPFDLESSSAVLRRMAARIPSMLAYWDRDLRCRFANQAYERWFGVDPGALLGTTLNDLLGPTLFALNKQHIDAALRGQPQVFERMLPGPGGVVRIGLAHYVPDTVAGVVVGFVVEVTDVSSLKKTEAALRASESLLDRTGRIAGIGGWEIELVDRCVTWSDRTRRIHEVEADYRPGTRELLEFYTPEARPLLQQALRQAVEHGTPWDLELPFVTARGRKLWVRTTGEVEYESGQPVRLVGALQDITEQRLRRAELQHEQELRLQIEQHAHTLERLLRERDEMLNVLAHEVRQPLNNASASLQSAAAALAEFGEKVASRRLTRAQAVMAQVASSIDNTLAAASSLATQNPIRRELTEVDTLVSIAIADMPLAERNRVRVERLADIRSVLVDTSLMRLALRNLLSNALKFSPADSPVLVRLTDCDEPPGLWVDVIDTGTGVPAPLVPRLFERGARGEKDQAIGLGLGLYIVRRVMEMHGGSACLVANGPGGVAMRLVLNETPHD